MGIRELFGGAQGRQYRVYMNTVTADVLGMDVAQLYRTQPALRAVVSFLADNIAGLPLKVYRRESDTDRERDTESSLAILLSRPSSTMTTHELIRATASDYLLYGNALWYPIESTTAESGYEIAFIPWSWVKQDMTIDGLAPTAYEIANPATGARTTIDAADCIRFYAYDPEGSWGSASPVEALRQVLSEQISAWSFRNATWKNGGRVSSWLFRPKDAPPWGEGGRDRFANSWKAKFAGSEGTDTGGTPLLEDGMELRTTQFNAREAQWVEATTLTREDVSAVYHVNPSLIWHTDGQTYASAKDNARQLYADTLAPTLDMFEERITSFLVPRMEVAENTYVAFDLDAKLAGSFEERASVIQSAVGAPWLTRNEARAMQDMPSIDGGDDLIVPLNVIEGGLASPNDTSHYVERYAASNSVKTAHREVLVKATQDESDEIAELLAKFYKRQKVSVLAAMGAKADSDWWNQERWDRELAEDLAPVLVRHARASARRSLASIGIDPNEYSAARTEKYLTAMARGRAGAINSATKRELDQALDDEWSDDAERSTPEGVFDYAISDRSEIGGATIATAAAGWGALEGLRQCAPDSGAMKTWVVTSGNPRESHAIMDGETVPYGEPFSNGAMWPGDGDALDVADIANCQCTVSVTIP